jgi:hypothetical protein
VSFQLRHLVPSSVTIVDFRTNLLEIYFNLISNFWLIYKATICFNLSLLILVYSQRHLKTYHECVTFHLHPTLFHSFLRLNKLSFSFLLLAHNQHIRGAFVNFPKNLNAKLHLFRIFLNQLLFMTSKQFFRTLKTFQGSKAFSSPSTTFRKYLYFADCIFYIFLLM